MDLGEHAGLATDVLSVRIAVDADADRWDAFVEKCADATFFHRFGWRRAVESGLGHRAWYLIAERSGVVEGLLPLAEIRSVLFGHRLVSVPGAVYAGVIATGDDARRILIGEACRLSHHLGVSALELRSRSVAEVSWPRSDLYVTFRKPISEDVDANMMAIPRKQRAMVRKGIEAGLTSRVVARLDDFFPIYAESVRNLGTPVFPRRYFEVLMDEFQGACETTVIAYNGRDIAAVMSFYFRNEVLPYYGGSRAAARAVKGNDFMYWDLMCRAAVRGVTVFDYGRSKIGSGSYSFKKNWGFAAEPLAYEYYMVRGDRIPAVNPNNPKYRLFINAWKRLPLPLANWVGPLVSRSLG